jgi:hypothetical protein
VSDLLHFPALEVSIIAIAGLRLHERCGWIIGDVHLCTKREPREPSATNILVDETRPRFNLSRYPSF